MTVPYGILPYTETEISQNFKKNCLYENYEIHTENSRKQQYFNETYPTQRHDINNRNEQYIADILKDWPILKQELFFLNHLSRLLGADVNKNFIKQLDIFPEIFNYYDEHPIFEKIKLSEADKKKDYLTILLIKQQKKSFILKMKLL